MKKIFLYLLALSILPSCRNNQEVGTEHEFCDCEMLAYDNLFNHFYLEDRKQPYTGVCRLFYKNGQLKHERELVEGKNNGFYRNFSENGVLLEEGFFVNNRHHGRFRYYDEEGNLTIEIEYENGIPVTEKIEN